MAMNVPHPHGAPDDEEDFEQLACGRDLAEVWEQAADTRTGPHTDPHTRTCAYCRAALADLRRLREAALAPSGLRPAAPLDTSAVVRRVMDVVRMELRPGRNLPLGEHDEDGWIYESVAARTLRAAAEDVPGVRAGSCRITPPGGRADPARGPVTVHLQITAAYGLDLPDTAGAVRERVARAARERLGLPLAELDVTVTDLHEPPDQPQGTGA